MKENYELIIDWLELHAHVTNIETYPHCICFNCPAESLSDFHLDEFGIKDTSHGILQGAKVCRWSIFRHDEQPFIPMWYHYDAPSRNKGIKSISGDKIATAKITANKIRAGTIESGMIPIIYGITKPTSVCKSCDWRLKDSQIADEMKEMANKFVEKNDIYSKIVWKKLED